MMRRAPRPWLGVVAVAAYLPLTTTRRCAIIAPALMLGFVVSNQVLTDWSRMGALSVVFGFFANKHSIKPRLAAGRTRRVPKPTP
jgi:hypothetical protein